MLPVTTNDEAENQNNHSKSKGLVRSLISVVALALLLSAGVILVFGSQRGRDIKYDSSERVLSGLPYTEFPTLNEAFQKAEIVGLYFAASWCPMSKRPTQLLGQIFGAEQLTPRSGETKAKVAIVYVSSDRSKSSMEAYMHDHWMGVPFGSEEKTALKRHFSVCAHREIPELNIDRKYDIPHLFVFDGGSRSLISTNGAYEVRERPNLSILDHWKNLLQKQLK
jgi:hypothetical protein